MGSGPSGNYGVRPLRWSGTVNPLCALIKPSFFLKWGQAPLFFDAIRLIFSMGSDPMSWLHARSITRINKIKYKTPFRCQYSI